MLRTMQDMDSKPAFPERIKTEIQSGNFHGARLMISDEIERAEPEDLTQLTEMRRRLDIDFAAVLVASICAAILMTIAALTLFH